MIFIPFTVGSACIILLVVVGHYFPRFVKTLLYTIVCFCTVIVAIAYFGRDIVPITIIGVSFVSFSVICYALFTQWRNRNS